MKAKSVATSWSEVPAPVLARARGTGRLSFKRRDGETVLDGLYQQGCAKIRLPRREEGAWTGAVIINTAGGLTGGDALRFDVAWGPGTQATIGGQAAERIYRSLGEAATVETHLTVAAGAGAEWLPQETILFDGGRIARRTRVDLAPDAWFLGVEPIVFGRTARGEEVRRGAVRDLWDVRRGGRRVYCDALSLDGPVAERLDRAAMGGGARATATLVLAAPDAPAHLDGARAAAEGAAGLIGVSAWDGLLVARFLAPDGAALRRDLIAMLEPLRQGRPLPRVWTC